MNLVPYGAIPSTEGWLWLWSYNHLQIWGQTTARNRHFNELGTITWLLSEWLFEIVVQGAIPQKDLLEWILELKKNEVPKRGKKQACSWWTGNSLSESEWILLKSHQRYHISKERLGLILGVVLIEDKRPLWFWGNCFPVSNI